MQHVHPRDAELNSLLQETLLREALEKKHWAKLIRAAKAGKLWRLVELGCTEDQARLLFKRYYVGQAVLVLDFEKR